MRRRSAAVLLLRCALATAAPPAAVIAAPAGGGAAAPASGIERWLRDLGSDDTQKVAVARRELEALGPAARDEVRTAAVSGDPSIAVPAGLIWNRLRWKVTEAVNDATLLALMSPIADPATAGKWEEIIRRHGGDTVLLLAEMANTPGARTAASRALMLLLIRVEPAEVAAAISHCGGADLASARRLLLAASEEELDLAAHQRIVQVYLHLWLYEDAVDAARRGWRRWKEESLVQAARSAVRRGDIGDRLRSMLEDAAEGREYGPRASDCAFLARVASGTPAIKAFEGRLRFENLRVFAPRDLEVLVDALNDSGLAAESLRLLRRASHPHALYLRSVSRKAAGDAGGASADRAEARRMAAARSGTERETATFELGELMERHGDSAGAIEAWESVLAQEPDGTVADANSALRLAKQAEARREYARAADLYERALDIGRKQGSSITSGDGAQGAFVGWEWLGRHIEDLRRQAGAASTRPEPAVAP